jgi:hypothetical protein
MKSYERSVVTRSRPFYSSFDILYSRLEVFERSEMDVQSAFHDQLVEYGKMDVRLSVF